MPHRSVLTAVLLALVSPSIAAGQQLSLMGGVAEYDLSGVETSNVWAARAAFPVEPFFLVEPAVSYIHTSQSFGRSDLWMPEVQLQAHLILGPAAPYLGVGLGAAIDDVEHVEGVEDETDFTTSVAAGVRWGLLEKIGLRVEGRIRGIEYDWVGTVSEVTAGVVVAF
jgi:hypothetical protein